MGGALSRRRSLAASLFDANVDLVESAVSSAFVSQLANGSLPLPSFQSYIAQDAFFLEAFVRAYALALAHSADSEGLGDFAALIGGAVEELRLHAGYAARWRVELVGVAPLPATVEYTNFLIATAGGRPTGEACAAMTPCMRLYAHIGARLAASRYDSGNPYAEWIQTYASEEFEALAMKLERLLDRHAADTLEVRSTYRRAITLEMQFFAAFA